MFLFLGTTITFAQSAEAAIKQVCLKDTEAYIKRDFEAWKSVWHQVDNASMLITGEGYNLKGWKAIEEAMKDYYINNPAPSKDILSNANYVFNIQGDQAFLSCEQTMTSAETVGGKTRSWKTYEVRSMIKVDGQWKIYNQVTSPLTHEKSDQNVVDHLRLASQMLAQMGQMEAAAKIPKMTTEIYPKTPAGYWGMGFFAFAQKDKASAIKHLEKAMSLFDGDAPADLKALYEEAKKLD